MQLVGGLHVGADAHIQMDVVTYSDVCERCFIHIIDGSHPNLTISLPIALFERAQIAVKQFNKAMKGSGNGAE